MFTKLVVPLDRSALAEQALAFAAGIAAPCGAAIDLVLVSERDSGSEALAESPGATRRRDDDGRYLREIAGELATGVSTTVTHEVIFGRAADGIVQRARAVEADLVVMTSHGRTGVSRAWFGSVADAVIRQSAIPVLVLRPVPGRAVPVVHSAVFRRILVPVDGAAVSPALVDLVSAFAEAFDAEVTLLRVVAPVPLYAPDYTTGFIAPSMVKDESATAARANAAASELAAAAGQLSACGCRKVDQVVAVADATAQAIVDTAASLGADLIALSSHGRGLSRMLIGSVADKVLRASGIPMLVVRPVKVDAANDERPAGFPRDGSSPAASWAHGSSDETAVTVE